MLFNIIQQVLYEFVISSLFIIIPWLAIYLVVKPKQILSLGFWSIIVINPFITTVRIVNNYDVNIHMLVQFIIVSTLVAFVALIKLTILISYND